MNPHQRSLFSRVFLALTFITLSACGGNDDSAAITRVITDAPVNGLAYSCGDNSGTTSNGGEFECSSAPVTFKLGNLVLGTINTFNSDNKVYPQDFASIGRNDFTNAAMIKIARLLQSFDDDGDTSEEINILPEIAAKFNGTHDIASDSIEALANIAGVELVSKARAISHLRRTLKGDDVKAVGFSIQINIADADPNTLEINKDILLKIRGVELQDVTNTHLSNNLTLTANSDKTIIVYLKNIPETDQDLKLTTKAEGYIDSGASIVLSADKKLYEINLGLVKDQAGSVARGVFADKQDVESKINASGEVTEDIVVDNKEAADKPGVKFTIPAGTVLTDKEGNVVKGVKLSVTNFDPEEQQALAAYPGGLNVMAEVDGFNIGGQPQAGEQEINFKSAGFTAISLVDEDGNKVKNFSQDIEVAMQFKVGTKDGDGNVVAIGDEVPIWSYDEDTGKWGYEKVGTVQDLDLTDDLYDVVYSLNHLSYWNIDWHYGDKCRPQFNIVDGVGSPALGNYVFRLRVHSSPMVDKYSGYYQQDGIIDFLNAPAGFDGVFDVLSLNRETVISSFTFDSLCDGNGDGRQFTVIANKSTANAGRDVVKILGEDDSTFTQTATDVVGTGAVTYRSLDLDVATVDANTGEVTLTGVGQVTIIIDIAADAAYQAGNTSYELTVFSGTQQLNAGEDIAKDFGDEPFSQLASARGNGLITYSFVEQQLEIEFENPPANTVATIRNTGEVTIIGTGTVEILASIVATGGFPAATDSYILTVGKGAQPANGAGSDVTKTFGDAPFTQAASVLGIGTILYTTSDNQVATVNPNTGLVTIQGAGVATITVSKDADESYEAGTDSYLLTVNKADDTISLGANIAKTFGAVPFTQAATDILGSGLVSYSSSDGGVATVDASGRVTLQGGGTAIIAVITVTDEDYNAGSSSYILTVNKGSRTVNAGTTRQEATNSSSFIQNISISPAPIISSSISYSSSDANIAAVNATTGSVNVTGRVGDVTITVNVAENANYLSASASYLVHVNIELNAGRQDTQVDLDWSSVTDASHYRIYYGESTFAGLDDFANYNTVGGTLIDNVATTNKLVTGLTNDTEYFFVVTSVTAGTESRESNEVAAIPVHVAGTSVLNDTGVIDSATIGVANNNGCIANNANGSNVHTEQDCSHGRDADVSLVKVGSGDAGFDYTKLAADGSDLISQFNPWDDAGNEFGTGDRWSCVKDNHTGLVWEVKNNDGTAPVGDVPSVDNIHHQANVYRWGGASAVGAVHANKQGTYHNDWDSLVNGANADTGLCGFTDWRVATLNELKSIVHHGETNPSIENVAPGGDPNLNGTGTYAFPNTFPLQFWTASPKAMSATHDEAWYVNFGFGFTQTNARTTKYRVRLVRGVAVGP